MREVLSQLRIWHEAGEPFVVATIVGIRGSAPREPGAAMAVGGSGEVVGSISGGCVESAVYEIAGSVLHSGEPRLETFGISDEEAFAVGLTCGGIIQVLLKPFEVSSPIEQVFTSLAENEPVAVATVVSGPAPLGAQLYIWRNRVSQTLGTPELDTAIVDDARAMLAQGLTATRYYSLDGERPLDDVVVFVQAYAPPPRMLVFGAIDFASAVARIGKFLGYRVTVCDARPVFATRKRFPDADEVVREWPHMYLARTPVDERTVICALTHDPKFDVPLLQAALLTPARYIGAMGSRRTHIDRIARLRDAGVLDEDLARLASPIGLDIRARTAEETAVAIAAEIIHSQWGGTGKSLRELTGDIHDRTSMRITNCR